MKKFIIVVLLLSCSLYGCSKEEENTNSCKFIRNDDLKQEYSLENLYNWNCEIDDYTLEVPVEPMPLYGVKLYNDITNKNINYIYLYYQYGVPQIFYPIPEAIKDIQFETRNGYTVDLYVWSYDRVYLDVFFKSPNLENYSISGIFEKDFYFDNEDEILEIVESVKIKIK